MAEQAMRDFYQLSMRGRARRLRAMAEAAIELWDLDVRRLSLLSNAANGIFRIDTATGEKLALRIYDPSGCHGRNDILLEASWLHALGRDTELGVPMPIRTKDGELFTLVDAAGVPEPRFCMMQQWVPGPNLDDRLTPENYAKLGEFVACLHDHAAGFEAPPEVTPRIHTSVFPYADPEHEFVEPIVLFNEENVDLLGDSGIDFWQSSIHGIQQVIDRLYESAGRPRILHQDLHPWNTKICRGRIYAFDFEDSMYGHPVQDIATALFYVRFRAGSTELIDSFKSGYTELLPWPEDHDGQIDALIGARALLLANFVLSEKTPESRSLAPEYIDRTSKRLAELLQRG